MTAYTLHPLTFCKSCFESNRNLQKAKPKAVDFMEKRCDLCKDWIYSEGKAPF